jgi:hypothetical protein
MRREPLSARSRVALAKHQRQVSVQLRELGAADRVLSGALAACDGAGQRETLEAYFDAVQELRVSVQRLEDFLLQRVSQDGSHAPAGGLELEGDAGSAA